MITKTKFEELVFYKPPHSEQIKYSGFAKQYINFREKQKESLHQSEMLFQSLLHKAFNGELSEKDEKVLVGV